MLSVTLHNLARLPFTGKLMMSVQNMPMLVDAGCYDERTNKDTNTVITLSLFLSLAQLLTGVESRRHSVNAKSPAAYFNSSLICAVGCRVVLRVRISLVYNLQK